MCTFEFHLLYMRAVAWIESSELSSSDLAEPDMNNCSVFSWNYQGAQQTAATGVYLDRESYDDRRLDFVWRSIYSSHDQRIVGTSECRPMNGGDSVDSHTRSSISISGFFLGGTGSLVGIKVISHMSNRGTNDVAVARACESFLDATRMLQPDDTDETSVSTRLPGIFPV